VGRDDRGADELILTSDPVDIHRIIEAAGPHGRIPVLRI
jgi:hypothetical protein